MENSLQENRMSIAARLQMMASQSYEYSCEPQEVARLRSNWKAIQRDIQTEDIDHDQKKLLRVLTNNHYQVARMMIDCDIVLSHLVEEASSQAAELSASCHERKIEPGAQSVYPIEQIDMGAEGCPMRSWFYQNLIYPFPTNSVRRQIQKSNKMSMSNINGWFSNMRRRCGWNEFCRRHAGGDQSSTSHLLKACFTGEEDDEVLIKEIVAMVDYIVGGRARGDVGNWLTKIVGCGKPNLRDYSDIKIDVKPRNSAKRIRSSGNKHPGLARQKEIDDLSDDEASDDDSEAIMEIDPLDKPIAPPMASSISFHPGYFPHSNTVPPHRTFSGSSTSSSVSNVSADIHSRVPSGEFSRRPDDAFSVFTDSPAYAHSNVLPITFGGPPQYYGFQPHLPPLDQPRGMKRTMHQMDNVGMDPRAFKFARFD